ncbi:MAG: hypothetical protein ACOYOK_15155 [Pseudobdellovibrionaceae bacterium]
MKKVLSLLMSLSLSTTAFANGPFEEAVDSNIERCSKNAGWVLTCIVSGPTVTVGGIVLIATAALFTLGKSGAESSWAAGGTVYKEAIVIAKDDANAYLQNPGAQPSATLNNAYSALEKIVGPKAAALSDQEKAVAIYLIGEKISNPEQK